MTYEEEKAALGDAEDRIMANALKEKRPLKDSEKELLADIYAQVHEMNLKLQPVGKPLSLQNSIYNPHPPVLSEGASFGNLRTDLNPRSFRAMFYPDQSAVPENGGFKNAGEFINVIDSGRYDPRLQIRAAMQEGIPSSGGFSVPDQFSGEWLDASLPKEIVRNLCRVYPMTSETLSIPGWAGDDMSAGATHGGFTMTFYGESTTATAQTAKLRKIQLTAKTAGIYCDASIELLADGKNFETNLQAALVKSLGFGIDEFLIAGVGGGQPLGILNADCAVTITKETGQRADTISYPNLKKIFARQLNPDNAVWLFNATATPELLEQSVSVGTGGNFVPLLNETNGKFSIFGRPVYFSPHMKKLGDAGDCAFVDFNFYALGMRREIGLEWSDGPRWNQRERSFRVLLRFDGQPTLDKVITPANGDSLSPIVILGARA